jgi:hypothetical protein
VFGGSRELAGESVPVAFQDERRVRVAEQTGDAVNRDTDRPRPSTPCARQWWIEQLGRLDEARSVARQIWPNA